jgi:hypothetical protein
MAGGAPAPQTVSSELRGLATARARQFGRCIAEGFPNEADG